MSEILIYNQSENPDEYYHFSNEIKKNAEIQFCKKQIGKQFIEDTLDDCHYLFVHKFEDDIRGFATIYHYLDENNKTYLYINLICNSVFHSMKTRATVDLRRMGGKAIIEHVIHLARNLGCNYVKLSAIDEVIPYYYKLGFRFVNVSLESNIEPKAAGLVSDLYKSQRDDLTPEIERNMKKIITRYYPGYLKESTQSMLATKDGSRIDTMQDQGIPMIYDLEAHRSGGKKYKSRKNKKSQKKRRITRKSRKGRKTRKNKKNIRRRTSKK
tara:strand:- start:404 stop:1210 length:807 start_codon:yes stop_codon:yes gene_type:complete